MVMPTNGNAIVTVATISDPYYLYILPTFVAIHIWLL